MYGNDIVCRIVSYQVKLIDVQVQETFLLSQEFVNLKKTKKWDQKYSFLASIRIGKLCSNMKLKVP